MTKRKCEPSGTKTIDGFTKYEVQFPQDEAVNLKKVQTMYNALQNYWYPPVKMSKTTNFYPSLGQKIFS